MVPLWSRLPQELADRDLLHAQVAGRSSTVLGPATHGCRAMANVQLVVPELPVDDVLVRWGPYDAAWRQPMIRCATLVLLLCGCATTEGVPMRKGDPQPVHEFEPGPAVTDTAALTAWLDANRGKRLRLPVVIEAGEPGYMFKRARVGGLALHVTDLALGVPLSERIAQSCGRGAKRCALWLEGRYGEQPPFPADHPQYEVLKVGDVVDETAEPRAERAK